MDWERTRKLPFDRLRKVGASGIVSVRDFFGNPKNIFLAHEFLAMVDGATVTKFTVHYNLFGGSITALHTERHEYLFDWIDNFKATGCFCLTELGYGNNAVKMETTSTYDEKAKEFVVNCPTVLSQKYWITNGFKHASYALVFAQTIVKGKNEGISAFLVPIRDEQMKECPGVTITDMGMKMGQNGVDNATIAFTNVRIPRVNMMNRHTDVDENGNFSSKIKGISQRFFKVTERLLSGRLCIASMCVGASRACLYIAITYAMQRKAVGPDGESSVPIFDYQLQQNTLVPLLARSVALGLLHVKCKNIFQNPAGQEDTLLALCCVDKTLNGWNLERVASICRERCGG
jgi:acyl-CoA oxidase